MVELLAGGDTAGFARAVEPRAFEFPTDHGPHPAYRTEWWYLTGHLATESGRRFGYQLTFFRKALAARESSRSSNWATRQVYMAHLALTDLDAGVFHSFERFARGAVGLAGASRQPLAVWLEDWRVEALDGSSPPFRLTAADGEIGLNLTLEAGDAPVLQGREGLSRKGAAPGNASYYYSLTRMPTSGRIEVADESLAVEGDSWMDREWGTSALGANQVGWDWFALQLSDGSELTYYRLRESGGATSAFSAGTYADSAGSVRALAASEVEVEELARWRSRESGRIYPARWRITVPGLGLDLRVEPLLADQEHRHSFVYWEGAVTLTGEGPGGALTGQGYVELTGY